MKQNNYKWLLPIVSAILMGVSTWVLIAVVELKTTQAITVITTMALCFLLFWFLNKTRTGKSMRAFSDNEDLALLSGIDPNKVVLLTWVIAGGLATFAGVLYGLDKSYKPFTYLGLFFFKCFFLSSLQLLLEALVILWELS